MKLRNLALVFTIGLFAASCSDSEAMEKIEMLETQLHERDSMANADKEMYMATIDSMQMMIDELSKPSNRTTTYTKKEDKMTDADGDEVDVKPKKDINKRGAGKNVKKDVNKRGGGN